MTLKQEDSPWLEGSNFPVALKLCAANHFLTYLLVVPQLSQREADRDIIVGGQVVAWGHDSQVFVASSLSSSRLFSLDMLNLFKFLGKIFQPICIP